MTVSCLTALLWISCYTSLISHSFTLIPSLSTSHQQTQVQLPPVPFVFLLIYATVTKKFSNTLQSILYPLRKLLRALRKQSQDTRRLPEQTSHHSERPTGVLPYLPGPWLPVSTHHLLNTSVSRCICASRLPFSPRLARVSKVEEFSQLMNFPQVRCSQVCINAVFHFATH